MKLIYQKLKLNKKTIVNLNELKKAYWDKQPLIGISTSDIDKMKNDWDKVGGDLKWAIKRYQEDYKMVK
ncbi:hypothetical protein [Clostridium kluyveri]|uniref:Uncharacterized protein n=1 Tax=Clostridium kluyveri (strain ATCC 8527 / DSM 555 / NBRC 12016 / NCIMB 10680 / K1) TaxID=431943 RepID=A5N285_CLOK5|nr:hypothetical protein [Clostridium kluyveri]EDK35231.1 Hypothetical protein CKL_3228 [Clostridium kluyveri DSM 555]